VVQYGYNSEKGGKLFSLSSLVVDGNAQHGSTPFGPSQWISETQDLTRRSCTCIRSACPQYWWSILPQNTLPRCRVVSNGDKRADEKEEWGEKSVL